MSTPFPPPPAAGKPARKIWPWALGGCLLLVLLGVLAVGGIAWFGFKQLGTHTQAVVQGLPGVQEHFGTVSDAGMDLAAMGQQPGAMVFTITGDKGTGTLRVNLDPLSGEFRSATLTLPNGETREIDPNLLQPLEGLMQGQIPTPN
jgi:hypothetical protein